MRRGAKGLRAVTLEDSETRDNCCVVICQATVSGPQETSVRALVPVSGTGRVHIGVRVGGVFVLVADGGALRSFLEAWTEAEEAAAARGWR